MGLPSDKEEIGFLLPSKQSLATGGIELTVTCEAHVAIGSKDVIGESPAWIAETRTILWTDNKNGIVHEASLDDAGGCKLVRQIDMGFRIGAALPRRGGGLIVAGGINFYLVDAAGATAQFAQLDVDPVTCHMNDAKCDPQGRLWAGTLDSDVNKPGQPIIPGRSALHRIDPDGSVTRMVDGATVSNGLCWSSDGRIFYYIDSFLRRVDAFDFDGEKGALSNRRTAFSFAPGDGAPDGMTIDHEDCLWVAMAGTGEVRRYRSNGELLARVRVPTITPTSCAFGGKNGEILFITSARVRLPEAAFHQLTHGFTVEVEAENTTSKAGSLFACIPGPTGPAAIEFAG